MPENVKPFSILIVDDEDMIRSLLRLTLVHAGYEVVEAETGEEGMQVVQEQKPDLVLLDVMMPGIDGFEVCRQIRQDPAVKSIPIIMLSAHKDARSRQTGRQAGANAYLTKPVNSDEVLWHVDQALSGAKELSKHGTS